MTDKELIEKLREQLKNALNYILVEREEDFTDNDGDECLYHNGGNLSWGCTSFVYPDDELEFNFADAVSVLKMAGGEVAKYRGMGRRYDLNALFNKMMEGRK